jgi:DNA-binding NarL/FixJ family response regulator
MEILLVDDHALFRDGLRLLILTLMPEARLHEAESLDKALSLVRQHPVSLCLLDLDLRKERGFPGISRISSVAPNVAIIVVSGSEDRPTVQACMEAGARSYIPKSVTSEKFRYALKQVMDGESFLPPGLEDLDPGMLSDFPKLTPRQQEVLYAMSRGLPTKRIARELSLSEYTVKDHISDLFRALGVTNRVEAVNKASRLYLRPR